VTDSVDSELYAYGTLTDGQVARERYIVSGGSEAALDQTVGTIRESPLTATVAELGATAEGPAIGSHTQEIFVEFDAANSTDSSFVTRGFVYDGLPKMVDGHEEWSVLVYAHCQDIFETLDTIRAERDAEISLDRHRLGPPMGRFAPRLEISANSLERFGIDRFIKRVLRWRG
jgi:hypothetical protein